MKECHYHLKYLLLVIANILTILQGQRQYWGDTLLQWHQYQPNTNLYIHPLTESCWSFENSLHRWKFCMIVILGQRTTSHCFRCKTPWPWSVRGIFTLNKYIIICKVKNMSDFSKHSSNASENLKLRNAVTREGRPPLLCAPVWVITSHNIPGMQAAGWHLYR